MGSWQYLKTANQRRAVGKSLAPLDKKLQEVEWGEYRLEDLFEIKGNPQLDKGNFVFGEESKFPYFTRTEFNNGILGYVDYLDDEHKIPSGCLAVGMIAMKFFYMKYDFYAGQFTKRAVPKSFTLTPRTAAYFISILNKNQRTFQNTLVRHFESVFNNTKIKLPTKNGEVDFVFMESFIAELEAERIAELEAYLIASGLKDYTLTKEEQEVLAEFEDRKIQWSEFTYSSIFNQIFQGRRLKKDDQIPGNIPFVMAGVTNTGVVSYISNPVASFPKNSITIDIFGNTFYRNYDFGAGDDTGVYWNNKSKYTKEMMLFCTASMGRSLLGKFSFGKKLRSSQSLNFKMKLPINNNQPDYEKMETFISAIQKLVIKDVVQYADQKSAVVKRVVRSSFKS